MRRLLVVLAWLLLMVVSVGLPGSQAGNVTKTTSDELAISVKGSYDSNGFYNVIVTVSYKKLGLHRQVNMLFSGSSSDFMPSSIRTTDAISKIFRYPTFDDVLSTVHSQTGRYSVIFSFNNLPKSYPSCFGAKVLTFGVISSLVQNSECKGHNLAN